MKAQGLKPEKVHEFKLIAYTVHRSMPLLDGSMKYVRGWGGGGGSVFMVVNVFNVPVSQGGRTPPLFKKFFEAHGGRTLPLGEPLICVGNSLKPVEGGTLHSSGD